MRKIVVVVVGIVAVLAPSLIAAAGDDKAAEEQKQKEYQACMTNTNNDDAYCTCVKNGGVKLNTNVPFVGRCINKDDTQNAFPSLIGGISKMIVTAILIVSFMMVIAGGVMRTSGNAKGGKALITKVVIGIAILGASGAILRLINPNFFK